MFKSILLLSFSILLLLFVGCKPERKKPRSLSEVQSYAKPLEKVNKYLIKKDEGIIAKHCERRGWNMKMTQSGLWYGNLKPSNFDSIQVGDLVELEYKISLLDGTVLYNSDSLGTKVFEVGHGGVENGLEEGVLLMKDKEKFRFIMPPHKAYGLLGDQNRIPARSIIVYDAEIINIARK